MKAECSGAYPGGNKKPCLSSSNWVGFGWWESENRQGCVPRDQERSGSDVNVPSTEHETWNLPCQVSSISTNPGGAWKFVFPSGCCVSSLSFSDKGRSDLLDLTIPSLTSWKRILKSPARRRGLKDTSRSRTSLPTLDPAIKILDGSVEAPNWRNLLPFYWMRRINPSPSSSLRLVKSGQISL